MSLVAIVDYGMGNLRSVLQALNHVKTEQQEVVITAEASVIDRADRIVLPGQGAMKDCMRAIHGSGLLDSVLHAATYKPMFGICVGEQMLFERSEEGESSCLGLFPGEVVRFDPTLTTHQGLKVPHMGWNQVTQAKHHPMWDGIADGAWFYFVHSYFVRPANDDHVAGISNHGQDFVCAVAKENIFATQFHPEKSADDGLRLYHNFLRWHP